MTTTTVRAPRRPAASPPEPAPPVLPGWLARMFPAGMRRRMVDVDGARVHVAEWGPVDALPVLMLHGNPSWGLLYRKVVAELLDEPLRLVVPDLVGLGCSDKPRDPAAHSLVAHGRWIGNLIDRLGLPELVFVGQDWGGPIGLHALAHRLERVRGMVILNTVVGPPRPGFRPTAFHRLARLPVVAELLFRLGFPQHVMTLAQGRRTSLLGRATLGYRWPLRHVADRVAPLALARMVPDSLDHPTVAALASCQEVITGFRGPIAIVWGDRDPVLGRVRSHLERLLPAATVTRTRAGHFLQEEVPGEIAAAIREVVARSRAN
jgi:cis-3-alkyl-4-acyloxetan-2-one decarboxylase